MQQHTPQPARPRSPTGPARIAPLAALMLVGALASGPRAIDAPAARIPLDEPLAPLVRGPVLNPDETGVAVLLLPEGRPIFMRNADRPLVPASTLKILTSAATLALLKPEFTYKT